jgi:hypothetical protein
MIRAHNVPVAEDDPAFPPAPLNGKNARFPRCVDQLDNVHDMQILQLSGKRHVGYYSSGVLKYMPSMHKLRKIPMTMLIQLELFPGPIGQPLACSALRVKDSVVPQ